MVKYSVVIKCLNGAGTIQQALDSLLAQEAPFPWEIILSDNGSTDATRAIFARTANRRPDIPMRIIDASAHRGKSNALNIGIRAARADRLLFLDADDRLSPGYLVAMDAALERHDFVASRLELGSLNDGWRAAQRRNRQTEGLAITPHAPHCPNAGGATLGFHRRVFDTVGGFDPAMTCLEDVDFCIRAHLAGFRLVSVPDAIYNYRYRDTPTEIYRQASDYAKARAQLRKSYADTPTFFAPGPWLGLLATFLTLGLSTAKFRLRRRVRAPQAEARFQQQFGRAMGELRGAIAFRTPPPPERASSLATTLARPARVLRRQVDKLFHGATIAVRTGDRAMALTFDDGPDPETTPRLLDALARGNARATFFVIGSRAENHPDLIARIAAEGHEIGNHTWDHPSLPLLSRDRVRDQLARTRALLAPLGQRLMRPPYGDQTPAVNRVARRLGYAVILWSISCGDWRGEDAETLAERITSRAAPGAIVLMHDALHSFENEVYRDRTPTIAAVAKVIESLPEYRFVTVSELLARGKPVRVARFKVTSADAIEALRRADAVDPGETGRISTL